jgi:hypothetical protein
LGLPRLSSTPAGMLTPGRLAPTPSMPSTPPPYVPLHLDYRCMQATG